MANLKGRTFFGMRFDFELTPILPTYDGPRDAYRAAIWENGEKVFEQVYSVSTFTHDHYDLWLLANAFQHAPDLMDLERPYPPDPLPPESYFRGYDQGLCVRQHVTWLQAILSGSTFQGDPRFLVIVYLDEEANGNYATMSLRSTRFVSARVVCFPEEAAAFGHELEREMIRARHLRDELGLYGPWEEPEEPYEPDEDEDEEDDAG
jgi:hypothetical protein